MVKHMTSSSVPSSAAPSAVSEFLADDPLPLVRLANKSTDLGPVETQTVLMVERSMFRPSMVIDFGKLGARFAYSTDDRFLYVALRTEFLRSWFGTLKLSSKYQEWLGHALASREAGILR